MQNTGAKDSRNQGTKIYYYILYAFKIAEQMLQLILGAKPQTAKPWGLAELLVPVGFCTPNLGFRV